MYVYDKEIETVAQPIMTFSLLSTFFSLSSAYFSCHAAPSLPFFPFPSLCLLQAQYVFIHDSLSELVVCGETDMVAGNLRIKMIQLQKPVPGDPSGLIGFQKQFQVSQEQCNSM